MEDKRVTLAAVAGAHGVGGEVRLKLFTANLGNFSSYRRYVCGGRTLTLVRARDGSRGAIAQFEEIADRTAAEALRGEELTVPRSALPPLEEGEYYHADLIGRAVATPDGQPVGAVVAVENFGAGDILEIAPEDGQPFMVPIAAATLADPILLDPDFLP